jgi:acetylornithine deacetylase/succinyl-diaminopimelate desuccinylase-like protein
VLPLERAVTDEIAAGRTELVSLVAELVGFDTTAREPGDPPRQEAALQQYLANRLAAVGASVDLWEPQAGTLGSPLVAFERSHRRGDSGSR